ncbi:MAG: NDP-sugar synthase [Solirubrobacterales bacterium]|nr:NDP-sugar synthase [Solirubrobacterales bacterium]
MQALILAGGEGTRLRPLTWTMPKPIVPLVDRPFIVYMIEWLSDHGIDEVILASGFMAGRLREELGDGRSLGVRLRYLEEPEPLGTGGALKFAEELLEERFLMLNGDVLTDIDLSSQLFQHEQTGAQATLALIAVEDPSAYGLVRLRGDQSVAAFVEKPGPEHVDVNLINAGAYVIEREVLAGMPPAGTNFSIERDVFPNLVGRGLFGYQASGYWLDIGTPERYLQATFDILEGNVSTHLEARLRSVRHALIDGAEIAGRVVAPCLIGRDSRVAEGAVVGGRAVLGKAVTIERGAHVESSVLLDGATVGTRTTIRSSIVGPGAVVGRHCHISDRVVLGERVSVGAENVLGAGMRIFPGVALPERAISF